jgi:hypothetical protein
VKLERQAEILTRAMAAFDLGLGTGALLAPRQTLRLMGHREPSPDAAQLFRRCGPIWLTYAAAHMLAAKRGEPRDWWALAWLRGTEITTDALWSFSPAFERPGARAALWGAGAGNLAMALGFARVSGRPRARRAGRAGARRLSRLRGRLTG